MADTLTQKPGYAAELHVCTGIVALTVGNRSCEVLLRRLRTNTRKNGVWALLGDDIHPNEPLEVCARCTLTDWTGVGDLHLEQLYTFDRPGRRPASRVITVAYLSVLPAHRTAAGGQDIAWWDVENPPELDPGHDEIIRMGMRRLTAKLDYTTVVFRLLPETFTLSEAQAVYETILNQRIDKRNFRKRLLAMGYVEATGQQRRDGSHRPARLFRYTAPGETHATK